MDYFPGQAKPVMVPYLCVPVALGRERSSPFQLFSLLYPRMTAGRLLFATGPPLDIPVALRFEEHDLAASIRTPNQAYRGQVPMLTPYLKP